MFAKVIVDVAHASVDRIFEYRIPDAMRLTVGQRVMVPFGPGNKKTEGYVIGLGDTCAYVESAVKSVLCPIEDFAAFTQGQLRLAEWMKGFYHTALCVALRLMFPAEMRGHRVAEKTTAYLSLAPGDADALRKNFYTRDGRPKAPKRIALLELLQGPEKVALHALPQDLRAAAAAAVSAGWAVKEEIPHLRRPYGEGDAPRKDYALSTWQQDALSRIKQGMESAGRFLLHGVTGSGKTEVYLRAIEHALRLQKTAILLVPEISLTPQMLQMFRERLCEDIAVMHSGLSAGERYDAWRSVRTGGCRVVIGARSAVFAPLRDIGVIIMDEEHESSYKSDIHPKYLTHEVAAKRAEIEGCALILGSATPSVETYHAAQNGAYRLITMPKRLFELELPGVTVVDMREEIRKGNRTILSGVLFSGIQKALAAGRQVMLFLNRRGYATFVMCRGCGYVEMCEYCDVTMTYHRAANGLKCHYCGRTRPVRTVCPQCGKPYLKQFGVGTQRVEEAINRFFPAARVLRMDHDTMQKKGAHADMYERFKNGEADILIGTQMIAKGFDFDNVSLVGVIAADTSLRFPDYRSTERTFQLIEQVAGRAGRKSEGRVVVQTYSPEHYAIRFAAAHDYAGFYEQEADIRRKSLLPPFGVFLRFVFSGAKEEDVARAANDFKEGLAVKLDAYRESVLLFESGAAPVKKIEGRTRCQLLLKIKNDHAAETIKSLLYEYMTGKKYAGCVFGLEVNPLNMV